MDEISNDMLELGTDDDKSLPNTENLRDRLESQQLVLEHFLELYLEIQRLKPSRINISQDEDGSCLVTLSHGKGGGGNQESNDYRSSVDFSKVSHEALCEFIISRTSRWPKISDSLFESISSNGVSIRFAPLRDLQLRAQIFFDVNTNYLGPTLALDNIEVTGVDRLLPLIGLESGYKMPFLELIRNRAGIALVNRPLISADISAQSIISSLRPDCLIVESDPTPGEIGVLSEVARNNLVILVLDHGDPLSMLQHLRMISTYNRSREEDFWESVKFLFVHKRVRRNCPSCVRSVDVPHSMIDLFPQEVRNFIADSYSYGSRCEDCNSTGFRGTVGLNSFCSVSSSTKEMLLERSATPVKIVSGLLVSNCRPLLLDGLNKVNKGETTFSEIINIVPKLSSDEKTAIREYYKQSSSFAPNTGISDVPHSPSPTDTGRFQVSHLLTKNKPQSYSLLVIEDDSEQRDILYLALSSMGYNVTAKTTAKEGLEALRSQGFDLVVTDYNLPDLNGVGLAKAIRQDEKNGRIPILLLTSQDDPDTESYALTDAVDEFCSKSVNRKVLLARISKLLMKSAGDQTKTLQANKPLSQLL